MKRTFGGDFLASIVVFLVALPLCMGIAIASGVPITAGIISGIIGGLVVGTLAGAPLQVSGPAAGLTVIVLQFVQAYGFEALSAIVLIGGLMQITAATLGVGQWFRAVSPAVIRGMLSGIGVLIFASQFHVMIDDSPKKNGIQNLITLPEAIQKGLPLPRLGTAEESEFEVRSLHRVGELHRRQTQLAGDVVKALHGSPEAISVGADSAVEQLRVQQAALTKDVQAATAEIVAFQFTAEPESTVKKVRSAAEAARERSEQALAALEDANPENAHAHQVRAADALGRLAGRMKNHEWAAKIGLFTIVVLVLWQSFAPRRLRTIPAPLVAVTLATMLAGYFRIPVLYVEAPDNFFGALELPSPAAWLDTPPAILLQNAFVLAVIASTETLLCASAVDRMHTGPRTQYNRELFAQGVGNTLCGALGGLPITGVIVRSSANLQAGGRSRLSAILHGAWLLAFVALLPSLLQLIPTASLAAILVYTGYKLIDFRAIRDFQKISKVETLIFLTTVGMIVATDLLTGVLAGLIFSACKLLYTFSRLNTGLVIDHATNRAVLRVHGAATFLRLPVLAAELERVPAGAELHVDFQNLTFIDHACLDLLTSWASQHESAGGRLVIDWDSLHARFNTDAPGPPSSNGNGRVAVGAPDHQPAGAA